MKDQRIASPNMLLESSLVLSLHLINLFYTLNSLDLENQYISFLSILPHNIYIQWNI